MLKPVKFKHTSACAWDVSSFGQISLHIEVSGPDRSRYNALCTQTEKILSDFMAVKAGLCLFWMFQYFSSGIGANNGKGNMNK